MENVSLMQHIRAAASKLKGSKLKRLACAEPALDAIGESLALDDRQQAMALVALLDRQCSGRATDLTDLSDYFGCTALDAMTFVPALQALTAKGYATTENPDEHWVTKKQFKLQAHVFCAIAEGRNVKPSPRRTAAAYDQFDFCGAVDRFIQERSKGNADTESVFAQTEVLEHEHATMALVAETKKLVERIEDRTLFYELCKDFADDCGGGRSDLDRTLQDLYDRIMPRTLARQLIVGNEHPLQAADLAELRDESQLHLTEKGIRLLFGEASSAFIENDSQLDRYGFIGKAYKIVDDNAGYQSDMRTIMKIRRDMGKLEGKNRQLGVVKDLRAQVASIEDRIIFYMVCYELLDSDSYRISQLQRIFTKRDEMQLRRSLQDGQHPLQRKGLVELTGGGIFDNGELKLTEKGKEVFLEEDAALFQSNYTDKNLLPCSKIAGKRLFFEPELERQLATLRNSLDEQNYQTLCRRLGEKHLPAGITVLFYGSPGTGKTESVMQMARATGRDIVHVDISATKTCWFGESEKLIKEVFTQYKRLCEKSKVKPILLFNEADAVFSKRKDSNSSSVAQTENAIQNIILEEMEKLDGILVATTNLADNLDKAFERRFLFKVRFGQPSVHAKAQIWKDKLPQLDEGEAASLAARFDLSGGEIENIARKALMEEVINGVRPTTESLARLCHEEKIGKNGGDTKKIGF